ncbi:class I SAM-dependent methyltransferase [Salinisphaera sp. SPP-AMP-43]|uniref:class I SAM-dependent DNA methyltransferase n=1 Tax=Salinisphaera sp. SPP-AMP-43 TaxID=3121288 RepID=UPI003C6E4D85
MSDPSSFEQHAQIGGALSLEGDTQRISDYYRDWAQSYDDDLSAETYHAPDLMGDWLVELAAARGLGTPGKLRVFDAGCGTGLLGLALARCGIRILSGADLSPEMVEQARQTKAYRDLHGDIDLNQPLPAELAGPFDAVMAAGVFTQGHVGPDALDGLIDTLAPGGLLIISVRDGYRDLYDLDATLDALVEAGRVERVDRKADAPYVGADTADYYALARC